MRTFPTHLMLNGRQVEVPAPKCFIGDTVYMVEEDVHVVDQLNTVVKEMRLYQDPNNADQLCWGYMVEPEKFIQDRRYEESEIQTEEENIEALQEAINVDSVCCHEQIKLFYNLDLKIPETTVKVLTEFLDGMKISYPAGDLQKTAQIYLNCGQEIDEYKLPLA